MPNPKAWTLLLSHCPFVRRHCRFANRVVFSELAREKMWARVHLVPVMQAEEDRDQVRRYWADKERERVLLGKEIKVYHSDRYVLPFRFRGFGTRSKRKGAICLGRGWLNI